MNPSNIYMGKLNSSIDIIPIYQSSHSREKGKKLSKMMKKSRPFMSDPMLVPRVRQYLEDHLDQTYVDVAVMAQYLRGKYMEYMRRKEGPFRFMVEQAYKTVLHSYGLDSGSSSDKVGSDDDLHMIEEAPANNIVKDTINNLYSSKPKQNSSSKPTNVMSNNELIDISDSTDEEEEELNRRQAADRSSNVVAMPLNDPIAKKMRFALPDLKIMQVLQSSNPNNSNHKDDQEMRQQYRDNGLQQESSNSNNRKRKAPERDGSYRESSKGASRKKRFDDNIISEPRVSFQDVGGIEHILKDLCDVLLHIKHPEVYRHLGTKPPRGFLLHGPPGCGKTLLAHAIAGKLDFPIINIVSTELVAGVSGETEERIREIFEHAAALAPCVLFFDEVDVISSNRVNAQKDMDRRIVSQLISSLDGLDEKENGNEVLVIGATNRADNLDPSLRRVGRFDQEICLGIPDQKARSSILRVICDKLKLEPDFDYNLLAQLTPGYVGGDLVALSNKAASYAVKRVFLELKNQQSTIVEILDESHDTEEMLHSETKSEKSSPSKKTEVTSDTIDLDADDKVESTTDENTTNSSENVPESSTKETEEKTDDENTKKSEESPEMEKASEKSSDDDNKNEVVDENKEETKKDDDKIKEPIDEVEQMSVASNNSDGNTKTVLIETPVVEWTLKEMEAWIDDPEPPLNRQQLKDMAITMEDFKKALKTIQPSAKREGFITVPNVTWDEVGSLKDIRQELQLAILAPIKYPERLQILGLTAPSGVLLCGPPGCGKTLIAKAIANEAGINFISVKGPELLNMYVGESERAVRQCFTRARNSAPCVIFFDEFDSLCPRRSSSSANGGVSSRVVNQLLTEMDGVEGRTGVFLMAATNRPDILDPAVMRPGRLDKVLYVGLPTADDRLDILKAITKNGVKPKMHSDVDLVSIANSEQCNGYTGADLAGLVRQASMQALKDSMHVFPKPDDTLQLCVKQSHFLNAMATLKPSVSIEDQKHYEKLRRKYSACNDGGGGDNNYIEPMDDS